MTIAVVSESQEEGPDRVRVFTQGKEASGETLGAAIDALQLSDAVWSEGEEPYLLLRRFRPDRFFSAEQRERLAVLMEQWRAARDRNESLTLELQQELESLVQAEEAATLARTQALLDATRK